MLAIQKFKENISLSSVKLLVILVCFSSILILKTDSIDLQCTFKKYSDGYNCQAENLKVSSLDTELTDVIGEHQPGRKNWNVNVLFIPTSNCLRYLPSGISKFFANLNKLQVSEGSLKTLTPNDFAGLTSLRAINIQSNLISNIHEDTFSNLPKLEELNLNDNRIQELQLRTFESLSGLRKIFLSENLLETLPVKLFEKNIQLEEIRLSNNRLRIIDADIISTLENLKIFALDGNFCISKIFPNDLAIESLRMEISTKCTSKTFQASSLSGANNELLVSCPSVNTSCAKIMELEETLMKRSLDVDKLESEKRELLNEIATMRSLKESSEDPESNCSDTKEYEKLLLEKINVEISRHNETAESLKLTESSKNFIRTAFVTSSFVLIMLLIIAFAINVLLIISRASLKTKILESFGTELKP